MVVQQPNESSPRQYEEQTESSACYFGIRRHIHPAIEIQPEELNQAPSIPGTEPKSPVSGLVKQPRSTAADVLNSVCQKRP